MKKKIAILVLMITTLSINVNAQWQNTGPEGGMVYKVESNNSTLLCLTNGGVYRSIDNGNTWLTSNTNLPDEITGMVVHQSKFYVSTKSGLYYSPDGIAWVNASPSSPYPLIFSNGTVLFGESNGKIYRSVDDGIYWSLTTGAYTVSSSLVAITAVGSDLFLGTSGGVWYSINGGAGWHYLGSTLSGQGIGYVSDIKTIPSGLLITTSTGIYTHNGVPANNSFQASNTGIPANFFANKILIANNKYFVSVANQLNNGSSIYPQLYSSVDGINWAVDNANNPLATIYSMAYYNSTAFICNSSGIFKSADNGNTWIKSVSGIKAQNIMDIESSNNKIYAAAGNRLKGAYGGNVFSSADNGATWQTLSLADTLSVEKIIVNNNAIIAFTYESNSAQASPFLYKSIDDGTTWAKITGYTNPLSSVYYANNTLFITTSGMNGANIDRSTDFGATWQQITSTGYAATTSPLAINTAIGNNLFANSGLYVSSGGGVYQSTDNGTTWVAANNGLSGAIGSVQAIGSTLFAYANGWGMGSTLFRSTDMGTNWTPINSSIQAYNIENVYGANGNVYVSTGYSNYGLDSGYVFESQDNGNTWANISSGLPSVIMGNISVTNSKLYVAPSGYSIWSDNVSLASTINESYENRYSIVIYPNPATETIFIQSPEKIKKTQCLNSIGQFVDVKFENNIVDVSSLSKGLYFLTITSEKGTNTTHKFMKE